MGDGRTDDQGTSLGWAGFFDLISSEYGWTDEEILELTLGRLHQIMEAVMARRGREFEERVRIAEAQSKAIVGAMPGLAFSTKASKAVAKYARKLEFLPPKKKELPSTEALEELLSGRRR